MNLDLVQSYLRIILTSLGAILAKRGLIDSPSPELIEAILGLVCIIISAVWSAKHQSKMKGDNEK